MPRKKSPRYSEEFKKTIVNLHQNGKSYAEIEQEYGVSHSALAKWIKQYSVVKLDDDTLITAEQIKALQKSALFPFASTHLTLPSYTIDHVLPCSSSTVYLS